MKQSLLLLMVLAMVGCSEKPQKPTLKEKAEGGDAEAQSLLGFSYETKQDFKEAVKWYRKAAEQGDLDAQLVLGDLYERGRGVEQDFKEAAKWFRVAAEQGNVVAQLNLGNMYAKGEGVPENGVVALAWLNISQINGATKFKLDNDNIPKIKASLVMLKNISSEQIVKAQKLSKEMIKKNPNLIYD